MQTRKSPRRASSSGFLSTRPNLRTDIEVCWTAPGTQAPIEIGRWSREEVAAGPCPGAQFDGLAWAAGLLRRYRPCSLCFKDNQVICRCGRQLTRCFAFVLLVTPASSDAYLRPWLRSDSDDKGTLSDKRDAAVCMVELGFLCPEQAKTDGRGSVLAVDY